MLPVREKGKGPLTAHGMHGSSNDEGVLCGRCRKARADSSVAWSNFSKPRYLPGPDTHELSS
jgi:hypothetical protein